MNGFSAADHAHMARALRLAEKGLYTTQPNPRVGCVIARGDEILGAGFHVRAGEPHAEVFALGEAGSRLVVVGWGSTFGPIHQAVRRARARGLDVSHIHLRHIWPLPANLGDLLRSFGAIIVPEMNTGQLKTVLRDQFLVDARPLSKVSGQPFRIAEIEAAIERALS